MGTRHGSLLASYTLSTPARRLRFFAVLAACGGLALLVACGSDDESGGGSLVNASSGSVYVPANPSAMPPLPPGAGPADAGYVQPTQDTGTGKDSSSDVSASETSSPNDAAIGDATGQ